MRELFHYLELAAIALCLACGGYLVYEDPALVGRGRDLALLLGAALCALALVLLPGTVRAHFELRNRKRHEALYSKQDSQSKNNLEARHPSSSI